MVLQSFAFIAIRDKFALACLDEKDYPEVEHLARVFENAIKKQEEFVKTK